MLRKLFKKDSDDTEKKLYITFQEMNDSFCAEKLFKEEGISGRLISAPSFLTTGCGLAWRSSASLKNQCLTLLEDKGMQIDQWTIM